MMRGSGCWGRAEYETPNLTAAAAGRVGRRVRGDGKSAGCSREGRGSGRKKPPFTLLPAGWVGQGGPAG